MGAGYRRNTRLWQWLAMNHGDQEGADLVELNLTIARGIPALQSLDIARYRRIVDGWTERFARVLPQMEATFRQTPGKWKNDIRFFRVGMLAGFLGHEIGLRYKDEQKQARRVRYTDPSDLFLNGLIDRGEGTCASMPVLHVAISRQLGWPVSLAAVRSHFLSRYQDEEVYHNIEATDTHPGSFASDPDEAYVRRFKLPPKALSSGSDLRKLTMREMLGIFIGFRARHFADVGEMERADEDYALARVLAPKHRQTYLAALGPMLQRGARLFEKGELGHPDSLMEERMQPQPIVWLPMAGGMAGDGMM